MLSLNACGLKHSSYGADPIITGNKEIDMNITKNQLREMGYEEGIFGKFVWSDVQALPYGEDEPFDIKELQAVGIYPAVQSELDPSSTYRTALGLYDRVRAINGELSPVLENMYTITKRQIEGGVVSPEDMKFILKYAQKASLEAMLVLMGEADLEGLKKAAGEVNAITEAASGSRLN